MVRTGVPEKVQKIVGKSYEVMRTLPLNSYDLVYIDGSHVASDVLEDAVLAWQLVKIGGFIIFDDYPFAFTQNPAWNTRIGIDAFMRTFSDKFKVIHKDYQVIIEKRSCNKSIGRWTIINLLSNSLIYIRTGAKTQCVPNLISFSRCSSKSEA